MRPKKLCLSAWGPYPDREEIDFTAFDDRGIFLITGATGAGKTTLFDAISYALYGALSGEERDKERNSVRSDFAAPQTPTFVELTMEHRGEVYHIRRNPEYFRPKKRKLKSAMEDVKSLPLTKEKENAILTCPDGRVIEGVREVNVALQDVLGLDYPQFKKISMIAQGEFARLLVAPPKEKARIFRELFGTGIYERFTQGLSVRARGLYGKVAEHKAKLAEDVRMLAVDLQKNGWEEAIRERLEAILASQNWNYEELLDCLQQMEAVASESVALCKKQYESEDREVAKQTASLTKQEQMNRNLEQFQEAEAERGRLLALTGEYEEKEGRLKQATNAGFVEAAAEKKRNLEQQILTNEEEKKRTTKEKQELLAEEESLSGTVKQADKIRELLNRGKTLGELEQEYKRLQKELAEKSERLQKGQQKYLKEEAGYRQVKMDYEEADHRRKLAAIGLAAALLEEGKPCPVCGSLEHPSPATMEEDIVSEEELKALKASMEQQEEKLSGHHQELITVNAHVENLTAQVNEVMDKLVAGKEALAQETDPVCREYLELMPEKALAALQKTCDRAGRIAGLLQEKASYEERIATRTQQLVTELAEADKAFKNLLQQYGFATEKTYEQARLSASEREKLQKEITTYRDKVAANKELHAHLQELVRGKECVDLQLAKETLAETRKRRENALKEQKLWERNLSEVKKTGKLMREKLALIETDGKEYGYIRDLENMAIGNNAKKLVFEQYVLAGYFEEILRAANIRFRKMTAGRYEMERVSEVGDGRVKDNMEIQVMDFYTGKYRSVRTLSGGESFKASLALALGMSDVIQAMNGGIRVDTLFVDEGFGALDEESLNQACDTLMALVEKNRLIGIISHVSELRERIDRQLIIDKTGSGSTIRNHV